METITLFPCDSKGHLLSGFCVSHLDSLESISSTIIRWKKDGVKFFSSNGKIIKL